MIYTLAMRQKQRKLQHLYLAGSALDKTSTDAKSGEGDDVTITATGDWTYGVFTAVEDETINSLAEDNTFTISFTFDPPIELPSTTTWFVWHKDNSADDKGARLLNDWLKEMGNE
jgi:hypothetical protein